MNRIVIASNNAGKLREIRDILQPLGFTVVSQQEAGISIEVEENGETFAENAALKARAVYEALHCPVIADDSGLLVDALDGAPGVHSPLCRRGRYGCRPECEAAGAAGRCSGRKAHGTV